MNNRRTEEGILVIADAPPPSIDSDIDARWAEWIAKGVQQDRVGRTRAMIAAVAIGMGLAGWAVMALLR